MFEVGIVAQFEAAHTLHGDFGPAARKHGHTYVVEVAVRGPELQPDGTLFDIGRLQTLVHGAVGPLHYRDLDDLPAFKERNSTAEAVALYLWERISPGLAGSPVATLSVRVAESPRAFARYEAPVGEGGESSS